MSRDTAFIAGNAAFEQAVELVAPASPSRRPIVNPEARLVFALACRGAHSSIERLASVVAHWQRVLDLASDENALIALRYGLRQAGPAMIPPDVERQLAIFSMDREFRMRLLRQRLEESVVALNRARVDVLLLKGSALATTVYESFEARPMRDIDVLVRPEQIEEARAVMLSIGWAFDSKVPDDGSYGTHQHLPPLRDLRGSGLHLEIHRSVLPARHPFRFTDDEIWRAARQVSLGAGQALVMDSVHHAAHIAIHFAWLHMMRVRAWTTFRDLDALTFAGALDWPRFAKLATSIGASSCCYWTLRIGQELAGLAVPPSIMRQLEPRMPTLVLRSLAQHFINDVARNPVACPSVRLGQALWTLAMRPNRHGHGGVRPWLVTVELLEAIREMERREEEGAAEPAVVKARRCAQYISGILM